MRPRRLLVVLLVATISAIVGLTAGGPNRPASAFKLGVHQEVLNSALGDKTSPEARSVIEGHFLALFGSGSAGNDALVGQFADYLHFDSARNPAEICQRWQTGIDQPLERALTAMEELAVARLVAEQSTDSREVSNARVVLTSYRTSALNTFGTIMHALADFYAHSDYIEHVAYDRENADELPVAPLLGYDCDPGAFPPRLQSGYASMAWYIAGWAGVGRGWCGPSGPPPGFQYCHDDIAKDDNSGYGASYPRGRPRQGEQVTVPVTRFGTLFEAAKALTVRQTALAWQEFHNRAITRLQSSPELTRINAECVWQVLAFGTEQRCSQEGGASNRAGTYRADGVFRSYPALRVGDGQSGFVTNNWFTQASPPLTTMTAGEASVTIDQDGRMTGGTVMFEATQTLPSRPNDPIRLHYEGSLKGMVSPPARWVEFTGVLTQCMAAGCGRETDVAWRVWYDFNTAGALLLRYSTGDILATLPKVGGGTTGGPLPALPPAHRPDWNGTFTTPVGPVQLRVNGARVSGTLATPQSSDEAQPAAKTIAAASGQLEGLIIGERLRGVWSAGGTMNPPDDALDIDLELSEDGDAFTGRSRDPMTGEWQDGWNGTRGEGAVAPPPGVWGGCLQWNVTGVWQTEQGNGYYPVMTFAQTGTTVTGTATLTADEAARAGYTGKTGTIRGTLIGDKLDIIVTWPPWTYGSIPRGRYMGTVMLGVVIGTAENADRPGVSPVLWSGTGPANCVEGVGGAGTVLPPR